MHLRTLNLYHIVNIYRSKIFYCKSSGKKNATSATVYLRNYIIFLYIGQKYSIVKSRVKKNTPIATVHLRTLNLYHIVNIIGQE